MSTDIYESEGIEHTSVTRFAGGYERGPCYQFTTKEQLDGASTDEYGYAFVTMPEAVAIEASFAIIEDAIRSLHVSIGIEAKENTHRGYRYMAQDLQTKLATLQSLVRNGI